MNNFYKQGLHDFQRIAAFRLSALSILLLAGLLFQPNPAQAAACSVAVNAGDLGGNIWRDFDSDGVLDASEPGFSSATVTAYNNNGLVGTAPVNSDGSYNFDAIFPASPTGADHIRLEFSGLPDWAQSGVAGTNSGTMVQHHKVASCGADLAVQNPTDYCDANPTLHLPSYEAGSATGSNISNPAIISFDYDASGATISKTPEASIGDVGSIWGLAYQVDQQRIFGSTVLKRNVGMGDGANANGTGYVYLTDYSSGSGTQHKFNLNGVSPANSADGVSGGTIDLGSVTREIVTGSIDTGATGDYQIPTDVNEPSRDMDAFIKAGKVAFGDIDVTEDNSHLWLVNLNQRALIKLDTTATTATLDGASAATLTPLVEQYLIDSLPNVPTCLNGDGVIHYDTASGSGKDGGTTDGIDNSGITGLLRPWGLTFKDGQGYLGAVCDASISKDPDDLKGYVLRFDPNNIGVGFAIAANFSLDFFRGLSNTQGFEGKYWARYFNWQPWYVASFDADFFYGPQPTGGDPIPDSRAFVGHSQPIISDIEFADNGNMVVGMSDLWGLQNSQNQYQPISSVESTMSTIVFGDMYYFCSNGSTFDIEGSTDACAQAITTWSTPPLANGSLGTHTGPSNNGRYYFGDQLFGKRRGDGFWFGPQGALVIVPGKQEVFSTIVDPIPPKTQPAQAYFYSQGLETYSTSTGYQSDWVRILAGSSAGTGGKGQALGDLEVICGAAPLEIGNYVWLDADKDGIQDPSENGLSGIDVTLDCGGTVITTTTASDNPATAWDENGTYYFSGAAGGNAQGELVPDASCTVAVDMTQFDDYALTTPNSEGDTSNDRFGDIRDSDGLIVTSGGVDSAQVSFTLGSAGENNHGFDFGFIALVDLELTKIVDKTSALRGDTVIYTLTVTNNSTNDATGIQAIDLLPGLLQYTSHTGDGTYTPDDGLWDIGSIPAMGSKVLSIEVKVK